MDLRILIGLSAFIATAASADITVETVYQKSGKTASVLVVAGGQAYLEAVEGGKTVSWVIWDGQRIVTGSPKEKRYTVMDREAAARTGQQVSEAMKQAEQMMASMPPAMREQMQKAMQQGGGGAAGLMLGDAGKPVVTRLGRSDSVAGYTCEMIEWRMGELASYQYCVTPVTKLKLPAADVATLKAMADFVRTMTEQMLGGLGGLAPDTDELGGFPVRTIDLRNPKRDRALKSVQFSADRSKFQIPAGYREQKMPDIG